jgi:hypothetical protein
MSISTLTPLKFQVCFCALWAVTLKHLSLCSNLVINSCLIALSDNLCPMNSEKTQSVEVSLHFFEINFICLQYWMWNPHSFERLSLALMPLKFIVGGRKENLISLLFCGLLVQKAPRLSFNSAINGYPRGISLWREGAFLLGMMARPSAFWDQRVSICLWWASHRGQSLGSSVYFQSVS